MARFAYHRTRTGLVVDCQADTLRHLSSRVVVPLLPPGEVPPDLGRLHPIIAIPEGDLLFAAHLLTAMPARELGAAVGSLSHEHDRIAAALDMLLMGY